MSLGQLSSVHHHPQHSVNNTFLGDVTGGMNIPTEIGAYFVNSSNPRMFDLELVNQLNVSLSQSSIKLKSDSPP